MLTRFYRWLQYHGYGDDGCHGLVVGAERGNTDMVSFPDEAARAAMEAFYDQQRRNPDMLPYIGPEATLRRFLAGDVVTKQDYLTDQSLFTVEALLPEQMRRLRWMLDNLEEVNS